MPHTPEVVETSHDRHDPMLVAALAAGDLAGTDRDQAISLTRTCADCAALQDDLVAVARATAAAPPPVSTRPRDFRLTAADADRLRPTAWRRLVAIVRSPSALSRPLGVSLSTLGLVGLLVGNVQLGAFGGSSAALPAAAAGAPAAASSEAFAPNPDMVLAPAASAGGGTSTAVGAASAAPVASFGQDAAGAAASPLASDDRAAPLGAIGDKAASQAPAAFDVTGSGAIAPEPARPLNVLFGAVLIVGLAILVLARVASRRPR